MKTQFLFPHAFRILGFLLSIPGFILGYLTLYCDYNLPGLEIRLRSKDTLLTPRVENFTNELALTLVIIGLLFVAFSKLKREDELTFKIRLNALYWAILVNYIIYALVSLLVFTALIFHLHIGDGLLGAFGYYLSFSVYNLFTPLIIFILIFFYLLYRNKNEFEVKPVKYLPNIPYHFLGKWLSFFILVLMLSGYLFDVENLKWTFYLWPLSLILWVYAKEKTEDEYINSIRLQAMQIAVYANYSILLISNFLVYGIDFWLVQLINFFTIPVIFIGWFQYKLHALNKHIETQNALS